MLIAEFTMLEHVIIYKPELTTVALEHVIIYKPELTTVAL